MPETETDQLYWILSIRERPANSTVAVFTLRDADTDVCKARIVVNIAFVETPDETVASLAHGSWTCMEAVRDPSVTGAVFQPFANFGEWLDANPAIRDSIAETMIFDAETSERHLKWQNIYQCAYDTVMPELASQPQPQRSA
jgi:hypothetical protein